MVDEPSTGAYPGDDYTWEIQTRTGRTLFVRPIRPDDDDRMLDLFHRLSPQTIYLRFHHVVREMTKAAVTYYTHIDYDRRFALVATLSDEVDAPIVAVARYAKLDGDRAECAFVVEDGYQGQGIGTQLLYRLAEIARAKGVRVFEAEVLGTNRNMMDVLRESGFACETKLRDGAYHVTFRIDQPPSPPKYREG